MCDNGCHRHHFVNKYIIRYSESKLCIMCIKITQLLTKVHPVHQHVIESESKTKVMLRCFAIHESPTGLKITPFPIHVVDAHGICMTHLNGICDNQKLLHVYQK